MQGELIVISPDGTTTRSPLADPDCYAELRAAVGGGIDLVPHFTSYEGRECDAYTNDEGLFTNLPENRKASELWRDQLDQSHGFDDEISVLHGPLAIVTGDEEFIAASRG